MVTACGTRSRSRLLDPGIWSLSCALFEEALEIDNRDRPAFIEKGCDGNPVVRRLVQRMLEADAAHGNPVDRLAAALAAVSDLAVPDPTKEAETSTTEARGADHA
jgi:hypothetical protein